MLSYKKILVRPLLGLNRNMPFLFVSLFFEIIFIFEKENHLWLNSYSQAFIYTGLEYVQKLKMNPGSFTTI